METIKQHLLNIKTVSGLTKIAIGAGGIAVLMFGSKLLIGSLVTSFFGLLVWGAVDVVRK